jgi:hypothetical protein
MRREDVEGVLTALVSRGVLAADQAECVLAELPTPRSGATSRGAEAVAWVGAVLAASAGITAASRFWAELTVWAQTALLALVAAALLGAGATVLRDERPAARRITGVTWFLATLAAASALGIPVGDAVDGDAVPWVVASGGAVILGLLLWRLTEGALQLVALVVAALVFLLSALSLAERPPYDLYGLVAWSVGAALVLLAWGGLAHPRRSGLGMGALLAVGGAQALHFAYEEAGVVLGLATVVALFALGALLGTVLVTAVAAAAFALFVPQALETFFPGSLNASATLFLAGVLLLAGALVTIHSARARGEEAEHAT